MAMWVVVLGLPPLGPEGLLSLQGPQEKHTFLEGMVGCFCFLRARVGSECGSGAGRANKGA